MTSYSQAQLIQTLTSLHKENQTTKSLLAQKEEELASLTRHNQALKASLHGRIQSGLNFLNQLEIEMKKVALLLEEPAPASKLQLQELEEIIKAYTPTSTGEHSDK